MMERIKISYRPREGDLLNPRSLAKQIGTTIPLSMPGFAPVDAVLVEVELIRTFKEGTSIRLTLDVPFFTPVGDLAPMSRELKALKASLSASEAEQAPEVQEGAGRPLTVTLGLLEAKVQELEDYKAWAVGVLSGIDAALAEATPDKGLKGVEDVVKRLMLLRGMSHANKLNCPLVESEVQHKGHAWKPSYEWLHCGGWAYPTDDMSNCTFLPDAPHRPS